MKLITQKSRFAKTLAFVLSITMLLTTFNISTLIDVFALQDSAPFTVTVKDGSGAPIEGATVTITPVDESIVIDNLVPIDTDSEGNAVFAAIYTYFEANSGVTEFEATYSVTAENYQSVSVNEENAITVTAEGTASVTMTSNVIDSSDITVNKYKGRYDGLNHDAVTVSSAVAGDVITYSTDGNDFVSEVPQVKIPGTFTVYVKVEREGFKPFTESYDVVVENGVLTDSDIKVKPYEDAYDGKDHAAVSVEGAAKEELSYSTDGGTVWQKDVPSVNIPVRDYKVMVKVSREYYDDYITSVEANVYLAEIQGIKVTPYSKDYDGEEHDAIETIEGTQKGDIIEYSLTGNDDYSTECPKVKDVNGEGLTVYVRIKRQHHNDYISFPTGFAAVVSKTDFIVSANAYKGVYDKEEHDIISGSVIGLEPGDTVTYSTERDGIYNSEPIMVKNVADSGVYFIKVSRNGNYNDQIIEVKVEIEASEQEISFEPVPNAVKYNEKNTFCYKIKEFTADETGSKEVAYEIFNDNTEKGNASIGSDGTVTYYSVGTVTVKASVPATDNYKAAEKTYKIKIEYIDAPQWGMSEPQYTDSDYKWYNTDVIISADGCQIIEDNNDLGQNGWKDTVNRTDSGVYDNVRVAFRTADGNITDIVEIPAFAIDKKEPTVEKFTISEQTPLGKVINFLTFGIFANDNITVKVEVKDEGVTSAGIKKTVLFANGISVGEAISYGADNKTATFKVPTETITKNSRLDVVLTAQVEDNVTNKSAITQITTENSDLKNTNLMIETIDPIIENISDAPIDSSTNKYNNIYSNDFKFLFDVVDPDSGLYFVDVKVNGVSYQGYPVEYDNLSSATTTQQHYEITTVGLTPNNDGSFKFDITVADCAGNEISSETKTIYKDMTAPIISDFKFTYSEKENGVEVEKDISNEAEINNPVQITDYGYYFNKDITVYITAQDIASLNETASGVSKIVYKAVDIDNVVVYAGEVDENDFISNDNTVSFTIDKDFKGQIYAYAVDNVGNSSVNGNKFFKNNQDEYNPADYNTELETDKESLIGYVHPNGSIVESLSKHEKSSNISIIAPKNIGTQNNSFKFNYSGECEIIDAVKDYDDTQKVPLYKSKDGIVFKVNVQDTHSGIRSVKWTVFEGEDAAVATEKTVTIDNNGVLGGDKEEWIISDETDTDNLVYNISGKLLVTGNHNNMVLLIELTDRAGNTSYDYYVFGIDTTLPTINIQYNVDKNEKNDDEYTDYFRTNRKAEIIITERNFRADNVAAVITKDGKEVTIADLTKADAWKEVVNAKDLDKTTYSATVEYTSDGDYTFDIEFTDNAENSNKDVNYGESIAPTKFTVDKTLPTVAVEYDNNSVKNGNYYKADRTATITITEHNFDAKRVKILEETPAISAWKSVGDVHTATIAYNTDGKYTLDIEFIDMAGNSIDDFAAQEFYIDKTNPIVAISDIVDRSANNDDGNIGFSITATDDNFDGFTPVLSAVVMKDGAFESKNLDIGKRENIENGQKYTVANIDADGIYSITCTVVDKAGNAYSEVILENADGKTYVEKRSGSDKLVTFSVNRNGSVFTLDSYSDELVKTYYVKNVTENVTVIEINADPILEHTVTLNGKTLVENTDYTVTLDNSAGSWYKYSYVLNKALFDGESEYSIVVSSKDKATNEAFSDVKDLTVKFVVDRTAPIVTVAGLKTNGRYQVDKLVVTLAPTDDGGALKSLIVRTVDENGKLIKELINLSGDELSEAIANGNITFELGEGLYQNVQIICEDYAGNISGAETDEIYSNVSVSSSAFMIFWANKPLRWGSIAGVVLLTSAIVFIIIFKKRKQEKE